IPTHNYLLCSILPAPRCRLFPYTTLFRSRTSFDFFYQSKNKEARILSNVTWVMEHIYFPANWRHRWPELYHALTTYQREGKNAYDDAPDALTGVAESVQDYTTVKLFKGGLL